MTHATPFLTFQPGRGQSAAEAMATYVGLFHDGRVLEDHRRGPDDAGGGGTVEFAEFTVAGQRFRCSDSLIDHQWDLTPALSVWVECDSLGEHERLFGELARGGRVYMPVDDYGFGLFGWVEDRFGISWQLAAPAER